MGTEESTSLSCDGCCEDDLVATQDVYALRLICLATLHGVPTLYEVLDNEGAHLQDPLLLCAPCWEGYTDDLHSELADTPQERTPTHNPVATFACPHCQHTFGWGDLAGWVIAGTLQQTKRGDGLTFRPNHPQAVQAEDLICLECIAAINDTQGETIWDDLFTQEEEDEEDDSDEPEG